MAVGQIHVAEGHAAAVAQGAHRDKRFGDAARQAGRSHHRRVVRAGDTNVEGGRDAAPAIAGDDEGELVGDHLVASQLLNLRCRVVDDIVVAAVGIERQAAVAARQHRADGADRRAEAHAADPRHAGAARGDAECVVENATTDGRAHRIDSRRGIGDAPGFQGIAGMSVDRQRLAGDGDGDGGRTAIRSRYVEDLLAYLVGAQGLQGGALGRADGRHRGADQRVGPAAVLTEDEGAEFAIDHGRSEGCQTRGQGRVGNAPVGALHQPVADFAAAGETVVNHQAAICTAGATRTATRLGRPHQHDAIHRAPKGGAVAEFAVLAKHGDAHHHAGAAVGRSVEHAAARHYPVVARDAAGERIQARAADHEVVAEAARGSASGIGERYGDAVGRACVGRIVGAGLDQAGHAGAEVHLACIAKHDARGVAGRRGGEHVAAGTAQQVEASGTGRNGVVAATAVSQGIDLGQLAATVGRIDDRAGIAEQDSGVTGNRARFNAVTAGTAKGNQLARAEAQTVVAAGKGLQHGGEEAAITGIGIDCRAVAAAVVEVVAADHAHIAVGGTDVEGVAPHAAGHHVEVGQAGHRGAAGGHRQLDDVAAAGGAVGIEGRETGEAPVGVENHGGVVAGNNPLAGGLGACAAALHRRDGDAVGTKAANDNLVAVAAAAAGTQLDGVGAALGDAEAGRLTQHTGRIRQAGPVAEHHPVAAPRTQQVSALPANQHMTAGGGFKHIASPQFGGQGGHVFNVGRAVGRSLPVGPADCRLGDGRAARQAALHDAQLGIVANQQGVGAFAGHGEPVGAHAANQYRLAHDAGQAADHAEAQGVRIAVGGGLVEGLRRDQVFGLPGRPGNAGIAEAGVVTGRQAEGAAVGVDRQRVAAVTTDEAHVAVADADHVVTAEGRVEALDTLQRAAASDIEGQHAGVAEHDAAVARRGSAAGIGQIVGLEGEQVGTCAADDNLVATAGEDGVAAAALSHRAGDRQGRINAGTPQQLAVVAQQNVGRSSLIAHRDGVGAHAAHHHLVTQVGRSGNALGTEGDGVGSAGGGDRIGGDHFDQAALVVKAETDVVAGHEAAVTAPVAGLRSSQRGTAEAGGGLYAGHANHAGDATEGAQGPHGSADGVAANGAPRHIADVVGVDLDAVGTKTAGHQLEAFFQRDGVVGADDDIGADDTAQHTITADGVEVDLGIVAHHQVVAVPGPQDVGPETADQHLAAVGGEDPVVAALVVLGGGDLQQLVGQRAGAGAALDAPVVTDHDVFADALAETVSLGNSVVSRGDVDLVGVHAAKNHVEAQIACAGLLANAKRVAAAGGGDEVGRLEQGEIAEDVVDQFGVVTGNQARRDAGGAQCDGVVADAANNGLVAIGGQHQIVAAKSGGDFGGVHVTEVGRATEAVDAAVVGEDHVAAGAHAEAGRGGSGIPRGGDQDAVGLHAAEDVVGAQIAAAGRRADADQVHAAIGLDAVESREAGEAARRGIGDVGVVAGNQARGIDAGRHRDGVVADTPDEGLVAIGGDDQIVAAETGAGLGGQHTIQPGITVRPGDAAVVGEDDIHAAGRTVDDHTGDRIVAGRYQEGIAAHAADQVVAAQMTGEQISGAADGNRVLAAGGRQQIEAGEGRHAAVGVGTQPAMVAGYEALVGAGRRGRREADGVQARAAKDYRRAAAQAQGVVVAGAARLGHRGFHVVEHVGVAAADREGELELTGQRGFAGAELHRAVVGQDDVLAARRIRTENGVAAAAGNDQVAAAAQVDGVAAAPLAAEGGSRQGTAEHEVDLHASEVGHDRVVAVAAAADVDDVATKGAQDDVVAAAALEGLAAGDAEAVVLEGLALPDPVAAGGAELRRAGGLQGEVVADVLQRAVGRTGLAAEQVLVGNEGVGHQQVVGRQPFEGIRAVVADDEVVAPVAHQPVAGLPAENVVEAAHLDGGGVGAAEGAVAFFVHLHRTGVFGEVDGVAGIGDFVAVGVVVQAGRRVARQGAGQRGAIAHAEHVAALPAHQVLEAGKAEAAPGVVAGVLDRLGGVAGEGALGHATGTAAHPAGVGAGDADQHVGLIAGQVDDVAAGAATDFVEGGGAGPLDAVGAALGLQEGVVDGHADGLAAEVHDVAADCVGDRGAAPVAQVAVDVVAVAANHDGRAATGDQQVVAAVTGEGCRAGVGADQHVVGRAADEHVNAAAGDEKHRAIEGGGIDGVIAGAGKGLDLGDTNKGLVVGLPVGQGGRNIDGATRAREGVGFVAVVSAATLAVSGVSGDRFLAVDAADAGAGMQRQGAARH